MASRSDLVVFVVGPTGVGKSKLGMELASILNGEIVSADSMQLYKSLNVGTAKVSDEEQRLVPHHLLNVVDPIATFSVVEYRDMALQAIDSIRARGKVPIVVGGTCYYVQSLLWPSLIDEQQPHAVGRHEDDAEDEEDDDDQSHREDTEGNSPHTSRCDEGTEPLPKRQKPDPLPTGVSSRLHAKLKAVDPLMANRLHPNDIRKITRSLQVFEAAGVPHSQLILEQQERFNQELRFDCRVIWLDCESTILDQRLDDRIDDMMKNGLLEENRWLRDQFRPNQITPDPTKGALQAIGYKEFDPYFEIHQDTETVLESCVTALKRSTRRYVRKQRRWILNRFATHPKLILCRLESSDLSAWKENVLEQAIRFVESDNDSVRKFRFENPKKRLDIASTNDPLNTWQQYTCDKCNGKILNGDTQWRAHLQSRSHRKRKKKNSWISSNPNPTVRNGIEESMLSDATSMNEHGVAP